MEQWTYNAMLGEVKTRDTGALVCDVAQCNEARGKLIAHAPALLELARTAYEYAPNEVEALKIRRVLLALQS